ncbi:AAA family ATPase [Pectobacterium betavasculorum]|uniref:AAA family ATPase n=2 Tax=Pectobacterium betavasculorum TaxID=55207 RepID=UPI000ACBEC31|nr:AAA family ATPase [Pectobacterium betavasculorum]
MLHEKVDLFEAYPFSIPSIRSLDKLELHPKVTFLSAKMALLLTRFGKKGIYLLDEPEAALSPSRQLTAIARMHDLIREGSQFVIATHSPILMAYPDATIFQFGEDGIQQVAYEDTEHYQITRAFLNNPERMLRELMAQ